MDTLTSKQKKVLDFIEDYTEHNGRAPSLEDIREEFNLASVSTSHYYIERLRKGGFLSKSSHTPRGLRVHKTDKESEGSILLPILGSANCGAALNLAIENPEGHLKIPFTFVRKRYDIFVLKAEGDSMNMARIGEAKKNIEPGDFVIIDSDVRGIEHGDYVLSIIDGCATIKKLGVHDGYLRLISESDNPIHKPIYLSSEDDFMISGKVLAVVKK